MSNNTILSNVYVPVSSPGKAMPRKKAGNEGGRTHQSLRQAHFTTDCFSNANGSSLVELGHTKAVCMVFGPHSVDDAGGGFHSDGRLNCVVSMPLSPSDQNNRQARATLTSDEAELSLNLKDAVSSSLLNLEKYSKSVIDVRVKLLQDDGGALVASIIAASLALADAGIECLDLVTACHACVVPGDPETYGHDREMCLLDPTKEELNAALGTVTVALMPNMKEVTYWDQSGRLTSASSSAAISLCRDGTGAMNELMRSCLMMSNPDSS